jgi:phosphoenolpyruvate carboxykinase (ATP)
MPVFNLQVPKQVSNVPTEVLMPQNTWIDIEAYFQTVNELAHLFKDNFVTYEDGGGHVTKEEAHQILSAGPVVQ